MAFKFNPLTGQLDLTGEGSVITSADNFSYNLVNDGETVLIPSGQEMVHAADLMVRGDLMVEGNTFQVIDYEDAPGLGFTNIEIGKRILIPVNRVMFYFSPFVVQGSLMVRGFLKEVA